MIEHMTRERFFLLSEDQRALWARRLYWQWDLSLDEAREFWFDGGRITGVTVFKLDDSGRKYAIGNEVATESVGASA